MSRALLPVLTPSLVCFLALCWPAAASAQLRTLSQGNADAQWRDAQVKVFDQQLAQSKIEPELKSELQAQRAWLAGWVPKRAVQATPAESDTPDNAKAESKPQVRKEPILDPKKLAAKHRQALFGSKSGPTAEDTTALQTALSENSGDLGLRQLQMHWIDQPRYRNEYWKEISDACGRVLALLEKEKQTDDVKLAMAFAYYRRSRAVCHALEGVHSQSEAVAGVAELTAEELQTLRDSVLQAANQVQRLAGRAQPEFFQLDIYQLRRDQWHGQALQLIEKYKDNIEPSAYLAEKAALLDALAWQAPATQTRTALEAIPQADRRRLEIRFIPINDQAQSFNP